MTNPHDQKSKRNREVWRKGEENIAFSKLQSKKTWRDIRFSAPCTTRTACISQIRRERVNTCFFPRGSGGRERGGLKKVVDSGCVGEKKGGRFATFFFFWQCLQGVALDAGNGRVEAFGEGVPDALLAGAAEAEGLAGAGGVSVELALESVVDDQTPRLGSPVAEEAVDIEAPLASDGDEGGVGWDAVASKVLLLEDGGCASIRGRLVTVFSTFGDVGGDGGNGGAGAQESRDVECSTHIFGLV